MTLVQPDPLAAPSPVPPVPPPHRPLLVVGAVVALVVGAGLLSGACRMPGASAPTGTDELTELGRLVEEAGPVLLAAHLGCSFLPSPGDQLLCSGTVDALEEGVHLAGTVVRQGEACRAEGDRACLASSLATARAKAPELQRLLATVQRRPAPSAPSAPAMPAASSAAPAGSP